jgi:hypothetical protein
MYQDLVFRMAGIRMFLCLISKLHDNTTDLTFFKDSVPIWGYFITDFTDICTLISCSPRAGFRLIIPFICDTRLGDVQNENRSRVLYYDLCSELVSNINRFKQNDL